MRFSSWAILALQSGAVLPAAKLAYKTLGRLNAAGDNAILIPSYYTGTHVATRATSPPRGCSTRSATSSSSPTSSATPSPPRPATRRLSLRRAALSRVTLYDNVACQHRLLSEGCSGVERLALVMGWSMGAMQAYQWAAQYPDHGRAILPFCGSAKCAPHNYVFLDGVRAALEADGNVERRRLAGASRRTGSRPSDGSTPAGPSPRPSTGTASIANWASRPSRTLLLDWEADHLSWDGNDLLAKLRTWQCGDISDNELYGGDFARALGAIRARAIVVPCSTDLYFTPEDNALEVAQMKNAELRVFDSQFGHCVASPGVHQDFMAFIDDAIEELLGGG